MNRSAPLTPHKLYIQTMRWTPCNYVWNALGDATQSCMLTFLHRDQVRVQTNCKREQFHTQTPPIHVFDCPIAAPTRLFMQPTSVSAVWCLKRREIFRTERCLAAFAVSHGRARIGCSGDVDRNAAAGGSPGECKRTGGRASGMTCSTLSWRVLFVLLCSFQRARVWFVLLCGFQRAHVADIAFLPKTCCSFCQLTFD